MAIKRNRAQCLRCGDIIESCFRHDYVECMCGSTHVDGGLAYLKRGFDPYESRELGPGYDDMSEFEEE